MAAPRRTQKQIAERYKANLGYYRRLHPWRRARSLASLIALAGGIVGIMLFQLYGHETFFNPGKISAPHARFGDDCAKCHERTLTRVDRQLTPAGLGRVMADRLQGDIGIAEIDRKCAVCHTHHTFHEPNVIENRSCSACHQEHRGLQTLRLVASSDCAACHNDAAIMQRSAQKGARVQLANFERHPSSSQRVVFPLSRPAHGFTETFPSFWDGHPEFQINAAKTADPAKVRDSDVLRFNHQRHFAADIPPVDGKRLDCNYCHRPEVDGRYMKRITFAAHCQACHSLQFDLRNPELTLPHGNAAIVRGFLRTLPTQYAELAAKRGITRPREIQEFVARQLAQLPQPVRSAADLERLERQVFFTTNPYQSGGDTGRGARAYFSGCAYCHEVKAMPNAAPDITEPVLIDRWMLRANFDHGKHRTDPATQQPLDCNICHRAMQSRETSDILMPAKADCVTCHSPQGKVVAECITCHMYHASQEVAARFPKAAQASHKQMLLGDR